MEDRKDNLIGLLVSSAENLEDVEDGLMERRQRRLGEPVCLKIHKMYIGNAFAVFPKGAKKFGGYLEDEKIKRA